MPPIFSGRVSWSLRCPAQRYIEQTHRALTDCALPAQSSRPSPNPLTGPTSPFCPRIENVSTYQALLADSTPDGDRSRQFTLLFVATCTAAACGPAVCVGMFLYAGNHWRLDEILFVLLA